MIPFLILRNSHTFTRSHRKAPYLSSSKCYFFLNFEFLTINFCRGKIKDKEAPSKIVGNKAELCLQKQRHRAQIICRLVFWKLKVSFNWFDKCLGVKDSFCTQTFFNCESFFSCYCFISFAYMWSVYDPFKKTLLCQFKVCFSFVKKIKKYNFLGFYVCKNLCVQKLILNF